MAETKTEKRAAPKRAKSSQKRKTAKPKSRAKAKSRPKSKATTSRNGTSQVDTVRHSVEDKAKDARESLSGAVDKAGDVASKAGDVASKAKIPLLAGGAALAGAAGGIALATTRNGHGRATLARAMRKPRIKLDSDDIAKAAKQVGKFSAQVGELAGGVQRASESTNGDGQHRRSPIEVVLQGLTARR
jgi:hypothetical protein